MHDCSVSVYTRLTVVLYAFLLGILNIWELRTGRFPIYRFEHDARIQALALSREKAIVATASAFDVVMLYPNDEGHWHVASEFEVQKLVSSYRAC